LVLVATFLLSLWAATYTGVPHPPPVAVGLLPVRSYTPGWAIPVAIALGVGGMVLAFLIYRPRTRR
jgi:hypothetical protein